MLDLVRRDAGDDIVAMGEKEADEADLEWREGGGYEPGPRRVVGCLKRVSLLVGTGMGHGYEPGHDSGHWSVVMWVVLTERGTRCGLVVPGRARLGGFPLCHRYE